MERAFASQTAMAKIVQDNRSENMDERRSLAAMYLQSMGKEVS